MMKYPTDYERRLFGRVPRSRTIPTRCPYCGAKVFFYTNEYGSKVFFDELGPPWPIHSCPEYEAHIASARTVTGPVGRFIPVGDELLHEAEYTARILAGNSKRQHWKPPIVSIQPEEGLTVRDFGVLREIIMEANIVKKLGLKKETVAARRLFRRLLEVNWAQVSIHVDDLAEDEIASYTMLIEKERLIALGLKKGCLVAFAAEATAVPFHDPIWVCKGIDKP